MNKEDEIPPLPFIIINNTECIVCKKSFKSSREDLERKITVSMNCPVGLFKEIFKNYIHYYTKKTGVLKCVFRGSTGYQELSSIFDDSNWGVKYYQQNQKTFVQLDSQKQEENPLNKIRLKKAKKNPKYSYGELIVEWKEKKDIDAKKNVRIGGFVYIHFFVSRGLFI
ncbi:hypothetical protein C1646_768093 [Rhizophagus diaphanus]|nr:hypothetical protein C1646_768093 [Rhizophagus diaphanus] [Rhizophagus sp. MUCL 43196]